MPFTKLNNKTFQALFDYASVGILITNSVGEIQMTNKYIEDKFGYTEKELLGLKVEVLIPMRYKERHVRHRNRFNRDPHSRPMGMGMELWAAKKDGKEFPVEVSLGHYSVDEEDFAMAFISDISQRRETELAIKQLNAHLEAKVKEGTQSLALTVEQLSSQIKETELKDRELQRVNVFLNNIWNHAAALIIVCDRNGLVQFLNPAAEKALGYTASEIVNRYTVALFHSKDELKAMAATLSERLGRIVSPDFETLAALADTDADNEQEWHYVRNDGSQFYVSQDIRPLRDADGYISSYLVIAIDISEKKVAEAELRAALEKEKELNELKSRFVSMASHEFRTPLSSVLSSAFLLSKYTTTEEQAQRDKHIQRIVSSVSSLTEILNDFLSVGKIEEGNIQPIYSNYDICRQIREAIQDVNHMVKRGQQVNYEHTGSCVVCFDASMMRHIIINLLSNAIKFSPENKPVIITTEVGEDGMALLVKDSGIGIPKADQESLFRRFFRSSNATNIQGTGLGLHIVNKYVELMDGGIQFQSQLGEGTCFTIRFKNKKTSDENDTDHRG